MATVVGMIANGLTTDQILAEFPQLAAPAPIILANLGQVHDDLTAGALVVISDTRIRSRRLPVNPPNEP